MDAGTATLLHFVPGDDSVGRDMARAVPVPGWGHREPWGTPGSLRGDGRAGPGEGSTWSWDVGCGVGHVPRLELQRMPCWCQALSSALPGGHMRGTGGVGAAELEPPGLWSPGKSSLWSKGWSLAHREPASFFGMHS